jgi:LytS/YehU family sensor histidine kinase
VFCWGIAGGLLGLALGMQITNMRAWRGLLGGLAGGWVGGAAFVLLTGIAGTFSARIAGVGLIGAAIGSLLALSERLSLTAWLDIRLPDGQRRQVSLGPTRVTLGANRTRCTVVIPRAAQVSYAFRLVGGDVVCEDVVQRTTRLLQFGETLRVGGASIQLQGNKAARRAHPKAKGAGIKAPRR